MSEICKAFLFNPPITPEHFSIFLCANEWYIFISQKERHIFAYNHLFYIIIHIVLLSFPTYFRCQVLKGGKVMKETVSIRFYLRKARTSKKGETLFLPASKSRLSYKRRSRTTTSHGARLVPERIRRANDTDIRTTYLPGIRPFTIPERRNGPKAGGKQAANPTHPRLPMPETGDRERRTRSDASSGPSSRRHAFRCSLRRIFRTECQALPPRFPTKGRKAPRSTKPRGVR